MKKLSNFLSQITFLQLNTTQVLGKLANARCKILKNFFIRSFINYYGVNMNESSIQNIDEFTSFNDFFTRKLAPTARTINLDPNLLVSPADGNISAAGSIENTNLLQAKGAYFSLIDLLGGDNFLAEQFVNGRFMTIYLAPKDYHRVHMPFTGKLRKMIYIPGTLYSVNAASVASVPGLFARNERVVCYFETSMGPLCVILIGALIVGSIVTVWSGQALRSQQTVVVETNYPENFLTLQKGAEIGHFQLGSTVIVLTPPHIDWLPDCIAESSLQMGQPMGIVK